MKKKKQRSTIGQRISFVLLAIILAGVLFITVYAFVLRNSLPVLGGDNHTVGKFAFTNQYGQSITDKTVAGKIKVVEYFFTTCKTICPVMNNHLQVVQEAFNNSDDVVILSHTVDPETDSIGRLKRYAELQHAIPGKWEFLTGSKSELYSLAENDYLLTAEAAKDSTGAIDFIHTRNVVLVDKENRLRGIYDATDEHVIAQLIKDIKKLQ